MAGREHRYAVTVEWTGNTGAGTATYRGYERAHEIRADGKPVIPGSSDPTYRGDPTRYNPEDLLVASLSACHMLWYLHLCSEHGVVVTGYVDRPEGTMVELPDGAGQFTHVVLRPEVTVRAGTDVELAESLHRDVPAKCYIARSVNFRVDHEPRIVVESAG